LKVRVEEYDSLEKSWKFDILGMINLLAAVHVKARIEELMEKMWELEKS
jgi:hypothetical protein